MLFLRCYGSYEEQAFQYTSGGAFDSVILKFETPCYRGITRQKIQKNPYNAN